MLHICPSNYVSVFDFDRHAVEKWESGGLPSEKAFEVAPSRTVVPKLGSAVSWGTAKRL